MKLHGLTAEMFIALMVGAVWNLRYTFYTLVTTKRPLVWAFRKFSSMMEVVAMGFILTTVSAPLNKLCAALMIGVTAYSWKQIIQSLSIAAQSKSLANTFDQLIPNNAENAKFRANMYTHLPYVIALALILAWWDWLLLRILL